jgi:hypothetical protein
MLSLKEDKIGCVCFASVVHIADKHPVTEAA